MAIATSVVPLDGEVDAGTADALRMRILDATADLVVLDAEDLTFIDSSGLHVLVDAKALLEAEHRRLAIVNRPRVLARVLDLTGLTEHFD
jgi:anti-sigma B factor antagonist